MRLVANALSQIPVTNQSQTFIQIIYLPFYFALWYSEFEKSELKSQRSSGAIYMNNLHHAYELTVPTQLSVLNIDCP
jgi:hypothetical protein